MHRSIIVASLGWILIASATVSADPGSRALAGTDACGHVSEMRAARIALDEDRRADAIGHLKEARRLLAACDARLAAEGVPLEPVAASAERSI